MTTINIVSGFLGAGKTTLIKKLIDEAFKGEKLVLIENEFGEIGIDGGFLKDAGIEITEMNSGCICCSLVGDFGTALKEVLERFAPDRILIEPSGVGKLSDVTKAVADIDDANIELAKSIVVADVTKCKMYMKNFGEFYNNQIEHADVIVLSRTQNIAENKLEESVKLLQEKNAAATIITTPWDELRGEQILNSMSGKNSFAEELLSEVHEHHHHEHEHHHEHDENCCCHEHEHYHEHDENCCCHEHEHEHHHEHDENCCRHEHEHHHEHDENCCCHEHEHEHHHEHDEHCGCGCHEHHDHHADEVFTSWGKETPHKFDGAVLEDILKKLSETTDFGTILRAKGIVPSTADGKWFYFDLVPGEYEVREGQPDYTGRLCVIGADLKEDALAALFGL